MEERKINSSAPITESGGKKAIAQKKPTRIGKFDLGKLLGTGAFATVRVGSHIISKRKYALKFMFKDQGWSERSQTDFEREREALETLSHPNITRLFAIKENAIYPGETPKHCVMLVMELCSGGELWDMISLERFEEKLAVTYFQQLMEAVKCCHANGVIHRDIKLGNILLDSNFNLKLTDFGFARIFQEEERFKTVCGTPVYMAPEIEMRRRHNASCDIFSCGVVLFAMINGSFPWKRAAIDDKWFKCIAGQVPQKFWKKHKRNPIVKENMEDAQDLFFSMCQYQPTERAKISHIMKHPWYKKESHQPSELREIMIERANTVQQEKQKQGDANAANSSAQYRGFKIIESEDFDEELAIYGKSPLRTEDSFFLKGQTFELNGKNGAIVLKHTNDWLLNDPTYWYKNIIYVPEDFELSFSVKTNLPEEIRIHMTCFTMEKTGPSYINIAKIEGKNYIAFAEVFDKLHEELIQFLGDPYFATQAYGCIQYDDVNELKGLLEEENNNNWNGVEIFFENLDNEQFEHFDELIDFEDPKHLLYKLCDLYNLELIQADEAINYRRNFRGEN